jgi:hypothetical protein
MDLRFRAPCQVLLWCGVVMDNSEHRIQESEGGGRNDIHAAILVDDSMFPFYSHGF